MVDYAAVEFNEKVEEDDNTVEMVNITVKLEIPLRDVFAKIAKVERRNMSAMGGIAIKAFVDDYIEKNAVNK